MKLIKFDEGRNIIAEIKRDSDLVLAGLAEVTTVEHIPPLITMQASISERLLPLTFDTWGWKPADFIRYYPMSPWKYYELRKRGLGPPLSLVGNLIPAAGIHHWALHTLTQPIFERERKLKIPMPDKLASVRDVLEMTKVRPVRESHI